MVVSKQLMQDGTTKTIIYKPIEEKEEEKPKYLLENDLDEVKDQIDDIFDELKEIKKDLKARKDK